MAAPEVQFSSPRPFRIQIPPSAVDKVIHAAQTIDLGLYYSHILSKNLDENDFTYGIPPALLARIIERLKGGYIWSEWEAKMNAMGEHGIVAVKGIDGGADIDVHFVHTRSSNPDAKPLLLAHGWPGSFFDFHRIVPLLTDKYHIVTPSLPGFTFSAPPRNIGGGDGPAPWGFTQTALCLDAVMRSLGYGKYLAQAGDWGSMIVQRIAQLFPLRCRALHLNFVFPKLCQGDHMLQPSDPSLTTIEKKGIEGMIRFMAKGQAYFHMQGTSPYTLGAVLSSSPVATIVYIGEKKLMWSHPATRLSTDDVLTSCLLYWFSGSLTSSMWLYYVIDSSDTKKDLMAYEMGGKIGQPTACGFGIGEHLWLPRRILERDMNVTSWCVFDEGGHFLAAEAPQILAANMDLHYGSEEVKKAWEEDSLSI